MQPNVKKRLRNKFPLLRKIGWWYMQWWYICGRNAAVLFTSMFAFVHFSSVDRFHRPARLDFFPQLGETEVQLLLTNSVDKSIFFYLKVFLLTNSSSWICRSSARRSRKSCIEATLVTTSSEPFVSAHMLMLVDNYDLNDYQRWHQASTFWFQDHEVRPEHPINQHQDSCKAQTM